MMITGARGVRKYAFCLAIFADTPLLQQFGVCAEVDKHGAGCILASEGATAISNMQNCTLSTPVTYDGSTPTLPTDIWQFSEVSCTSASSSVATSSQLYINGFSYGEAMISLLLLMILTALIFHTFWARLFGIKLSVPFYRMFLGNNSKEGKEIKNI
jgi:hypothetical protein